MTPYQLEQLEILRRTAERGKAYCENRITRFGDDPNYSSLLDLFVHVLDELKRLRESA